jgi:hypothetical protein
MWHNAREMAMQSDPYVPSPVCAKSSGAIADAEEPSRDEIEAFVGAEGPVYWDMMRESVSSYSLIAGFNVAAALLPLVWLAYRKLYRECALAMIALMIGGATIGAIPYLRQHFGAILVNYFVAATSIGLLGNGLYLRRIRIAVARARRSEPSLDRRCYLLREQGGTSWFAVVILLLALLLLRLCSRMWTQ